MDTGTATLAPCGATQARPTWDLLHFWFSLRVVLQLDRARGGHPATDSPFSTELQCQWPWPPMAIVIGGPSLRWDSAKSSSTPASDHFLPTLMSKPLDCLQQKSHQVSLASTPLPLLFLPVSSICPRYSHLDLQLSSQLSLLHWSWAQLFLDSNGTNWNLSLPP